MNLNMRLAQHWSGQGACWTKRHKPLELLQVIPFASKEIEDRTTRLYMKDWGAENVRGGRYVQATVSKKLKCFIETSSEEELQNPI